MTIPQPRYQNIKGDSHSCWHCQHFQRLDPRSPPDSETCQGECRFDIPGSLHSADDQYKYYPDSPDCYFYYQPYWPMIHQGSKFWCGNWTRSHEENISPPPALNLCNEQILLVCHEFWDNWARDDKLASQTLCWTCDHFQPYPKMIGYDPANYPAWDGECCRKNPDPHWWMEFLIRVYDFDSNLIGSASSIPDCFPTAPYIDDARTLWCSQWERARHALYKPLEFKPNDYLIAGKGKTRETVGMSVYNRVPDTLKKQIQEKLDYARSINYCPTQTKAGKLFAQTDARNVRLRDAIVNHRKQQARDFMRAQQKDF